MIDIMNTIEYNTVVNKSCERGDSLNIQYKKGVIELCILSVLCKKDVYGYELSEYISQKIDISDGTVYPILRKLKADGLVKTFLSEESGGPPRKYYSITKSGLEQYKKDSAEWLEFAQTVTKMLKGDE